MTKSGEGAEKRKRGRPPGSTGKKRKVAKRDAEPVAGKRGRGRPRKPDRPPPPVPLIRALPPPSAFPAEIILPDGESFFTGGPTPTDDEIRARGGGRGGNREPPRGSGAGGHQDEPGGLMRGRKPLLTLNEITLAQIKVCGMMRCTRPEAAAALNVSVPTFNRFLAEHEIARNVWHDALNLAKFSIRSRVFDEAMNGNTQMLMLLAKNIVGMIDKPVGDDDAEDLPEVENKGGKTKRIIFEIVDPVKPEPAAPSNVDPTD